MWDRHSLELLSQSLPLNITVRWDKAPSSEKYLYVNTLLSALSYFKDCSASFIDIDGKPCSALTIQPLRRKLCDSEKRNFTIVGHHTSKPLLLIIYKNLIFEVYFNHHLFTETETTYKQYFPSASVILRCRNFLKGYLTRSPGSWGSDIIKMTSDWEGTFILESCINEIPVRLRKNFRGYKVIPCSFKYIITCTDIPKSEIKFLKNNGFNEIFSGYSVKNEIFSCLEKFLTYQLGRLDE